MLLFGEIEALLRDISGNGITSKDEGSSVRSLDTNIRSKKEPQTYIIPLNALTTFSISASGDIVNIVGSASKTIKIKRVVISGTGSTAQQATVNIVKRSTKNTGGTAVSITPVPNDSQNAAATVTAVYYTAAPTVGTAVGVVAAIRKLFPLAGSGTISGDMREFDFTGFDMQGITLRGTSEFLSINIGAVAGTFIPTISGYVVLTEE